MSPTRKTRSMAPARFNNGRVSPLSMNKGRVHKTYQETFDSQVDALNLDQDDPLAASIKCKEKERDLAMAKVRELDPIKVNSPAGLLFKNFPNEIHQNIAELLDANEDIVSYILICPITRAAVAEFVWRRRFEKVYDLPSDPLDTGKLANWYKCRQVFLSRTTIFGLKKFSSRVTKDIRAYHSKRQADCVQLFKDLILQSDAQVVVKNGAKEIWGRNLDFLRKVVTDKKDDIFPVYIDILDAVLNDDHAFEDIISANAPGTLTFVIQLTLTPLVLNPDISTNPVSNFDVSQAQVYATAKSQPIFTGKYNLNINVLWLLYAVNFFKYHFKALGEGIMSHTFHDLAPHLLPQYWTGVLKSGTQELKPFWKGAHSYLHSRELNRVRNDKGRVGEIYSDVISYEPFQDIDIIFDEAGFPSKKWPSLWEEELRSDLFDNISSRFIHNMGSIRSSPRKKQRIEIQEPPEKPQMLSFYGTTRDVGHETAFIYGRIHSLPEQQSIPGFQRFVMKRFQWSAFETTIHNYEGCVLPGATIIVGRWWAAGQNPSHADTYSGPFLWWSVDREAEDELPPLPLDEILEFAQDFMQ